MKTTQHKCPCCGKIFWSFNSDIEAKSYNKEWNGYLCRDCAVWLDYINKENPYTEVIAGVCYDFLPPQTNIRPGDMLGGKGMKYILKKDGSTKKSNDIWKIGVVPQRFKERLSDTGWWISKKNFSHLRYGWYLCDNKGCYDRYHCLRYDIRQEKSGPYNTIPENWIIGDEKCPIFINANEIEDFEGHDISEIAI